MCSGWPSKWTGFTCISLQLVTHTWGYSKLGHRQRAPAATLKIVIFCVYLESPNRAGLSVSSVICFACNKHKSALRLKNVAFHGRPFSQQFHSKVSFTWYVSNIGMPTDWNWPPCESKATLIRHHVFSLAFMDGILHRLKLTCMVMPGQSVPCQWKVSSLRVLIRTDFCRSIRLHRVVP